MNLHRTNLNRTNAVKVLCISFIFLFFALIASSDANAAPHSPKKPKKIVYRLKDIKDKKVILNFKNITVSSLIAFISKITHRNFIYKGKITGQVTVVSSKKVTVGEAYRFFLTALSYSGYAVVKRKGFYEIVPSSAAHQAPVPVGIKTISANGKGFETRIIRLKYLNAQSIVNVLTPLISPSANIQGYQPTNSIIITDYASDIRKADEIIRALDVPNYGQQIAVYPLKYIKAKKIASILNLIFTGSSAPNYGFANVNSQFVKIMPYSPSNSLIIMASLQNLKRIAGIIKSLDVKPTASGISIHVYKLRYAKADEIAKILTGLMSKSSAVLKKNSYITNGHVRPGMPVRPGVMPAAAEKGKGGGVSVVGKAVIIPDKENNSLIIEANPMQYKGILSVVKQLDVMRRQVYVQVIIAEVDLNKSSEIGTQYGVEKGNFFGAGNYNMSQGITDFLSNPFSVSGFVAGALGGQIQLPIGPNGTTETVPSFAALFRLIATDSDINVLSAPDLLTLDNQKAAIMVGENVPFITSSATSQFALQNIVTQVERQKVGVELKITPTVDSNNYMQLKIYGKISAIIPSPDGLNANLVGPTTSERYIKTNVLVKSGQLVIIGGLIQNTVNKTITGIPLLSDIPILGYLFSDHSTQIEHDNLVILISPKVIETNEELKNITNNKKNKFYRFMKKYRQVLPGIKNMLLISPKYERHSNRSKK